MEIRSAEQLYEHIAVPGAVWLTSGMRGSGKSHTAIAVSEMFVKGVYPSVGKVILITNMIFFHKVDGEITEECPPGVFHVTTMKELFPIVVDIIEEYGRDVKILLVLDEAQNFLRGEGNNTNASLYMKDLLGIIRKFRMIVWLMTPAASQIGPAFRNDINDPRNPGNLTCRWKKDLAFNTRYIEQMGLKLKPNELMLVKNYDTDPIVVRVPVTEWTQTKETLEEGQYCYDHEASAAFYIGDGFDWELFNRTVGGVSSMHVLETIRTFYKEQVDDVQDNPVLDRLKKQIEDQVQGKVAHQMLENGMSRRQAATSLGISRDTLMRRIEQAGYQVPPPIQNNRKNRNIPPMKNDFSSEKDQPAKTQASIPVGRSMEGALRGHIYISKENPRKPQKTDYSTTVDESEKMHGKPIEAPSIPDGKYSHHEFGRAVRYCVGDDE